ncbi:hypothetical protein LWI28_008984 [Acer negundo]|uniref:Uncharacterized protein n=1 Tax=Acer negundo TaxID=4023 RepID=A0AAD5ILX6_ACENE|nr:hypothetical protein LWI28_008984 [Acer negundo]
MGLEAKSGAGPSLSNTGTLVLGPFPLAWQRGSGAKAGVVGASFDGGMGSTLNGSAQIEQGRLFWPMSHGWRRRSRDWMGQADLGNTSASFLQDSGE